MVKLVAKDTVGLCTAAGDAVVGVVQNKPQKTGAAVTVGYEGITQIIAGAACAVGDKACCRAGSVPKACLYVACMMGGPSFICAGTS